MQSRGQLPGQPPGQELRDFFNLMLLAVTQALSGTMLRREGFLRTGEELLPIPMSQETKRSLLRKLAEQHANLSSKQRLAIMNSRIRELLLARLVGKQSWQHSQMKLPLGVIRRLMTKCIPRIMITPISMPEKPVIYSWQLQGSVVYDPSGYVYDDRNGLSSYYPQIRVITSHSKHPLIALMHSDGKVWIGKIGDRDNLFRLIHSPEKEDKKATAIEFHPFSNFIAVAILAQIIVYEISPDLKPKLHFTVSFYESGYFCPKPKISADKLDWNPNGTFLTAISRDNLSMCFYLKPDTIEVIFGFNGGTKYAELRSFREDISPDCSCFSKDGKLVMTSYPGGTLMVRSAVHTVGKGLSLSCLKILENFFPGKIVSIVPYPHDPSVFAIQVTAEWSQTSVLIVLVSHDGSVTITATIPDAKSPHFHEDWLLVSSRNKILFHHMNRCNIPCLVTEFHLQGNGTMRGVEIDAFCVKPTPNGVMLYYSNNFGGSKLHMAKIMLQ